MQMPKNPMIQIQKNIESSKRIAQKRRDAKDLRNAGSYSNGKSAYLDEDGYPLDGVEIPYWFKNLSKAWQSNRQLGRERRNKMLDNPKNATIKQKWDEWCDNRVDLGCSDPRKPKRLVGRPRLHTSQKKQPQLKRSDQMRQLLQEHGITVKSIGQDVFLAEYPDWEFLPNGRLRHRDDQPISVHRFLQDHDLITM